MKKLFKFLGNVIFILFISIYILINLAGNNTSGSSQTESVTRERVRKDYNTPIEMTGRLNSKTPYEVFQETTPYDKGVPIFAHGWIDTAETP